MKEPRWRSVLCWGAVIIFLTLPLVIFGMALLSREFGWTEFEQHIKEYKFLSAFYQSITAMAFGLSGLHSLDRFASNHKAAPPSKEAGRPPA